jgi:hypothetical protein
MRRTMSFLIAVLLVASLASGCGCLSADAYSLPQCQKYHTDWPKVHAEN